MAYVPLIFTVWVETWQVWARSIGNRLAYHAAKAEFEFRPSVESFTSFSSHPWEKLRLQFDLSLFLSSGGVNPG